MTKGEQDVGRGLRRLMRRCMRVSLGTLERRGGAPYISLALAALDHDATPLLHLSDRADHTRNLAADARVSLLFDGTPGQPVPPAGECATAQGRGAGWAMTGLDPEGCDLRRGAEVARLEFDQAVDDVEGVRVELVRLARRARAEAEGRRGRPRDGGMDAVVVPLQRQP